MLSDGLSHAVENTLQIEELRGELYFYDDDMAF